MDRRVIHRTGFLQVPNVFFETCALPESAQMLFLRLAAQLGKQHQAIFTGSIRQLATLVCMSKSTVDRMLDVLIDSELITVTLSEGVESSREVMSIEVNMDRLWELNTYHTTIAPVPIWETTLPDCPKLGHDVPDRDATSQIDDSVSQIEYSASQTQAQIRDNTLNTDKTNSIQKKEETPLTHSAISLSHFSEVEEEALSWLREKDIPWREKDVQTVKKQLAFLRERILTKEMLHSYCNYAKARFQGRKDPTVYLGNLATQRLLGAFLHAQGTEILTTAPPPVETTSQSDIEALTAEIQHAYPEMVLEIRADEYGPYIEMPLSDDGSEFDLVRDAEDWRRLCSLRKRLGRVIAYGRQHCLIASHERNR